MYNIEEIEEVKYGINFQELPISDEMKRLYSSLFETAKGRFNLFTLFMELFYKHSKTRGVMCLIIPEGIYSNIEYKYSRELLVENCTIKKLCVFTKRVFEASVDTTIILSINQKSENENIFPVDVNVQPGINFSSQLAIILSKSNTIAHLTSHQEDR